MVAMVVAVAGATMEVAEVVVAEGVMKAGGEEDEAIMAEEGAVAVVVAVAILEVGAAVPPPQPTSPTPLNLSTRCCRKPAAAPRFPL